MISGLMLVPVPGVSAGRAAPWRRRPWGCGATTVLTGVPGHSGQEQDPVARDAGGHRGVGGNGADGGGGLARIESSSVTADQNGAALIS